MAMIRNAPRAAWIHVNRRRGATVLRAIRASAQEMATTGSMIRSSERSIGRETFSVNVLKGTNQMSAMKPASVHGSPRRVRGQWSSTGVLGWRAPSRERRRSSQPDARRSPSGAPLLGASGSVPAAVFAADRRSRRRTRPSRRAHDRAKTDRKVRPAISSGAR